MAEPNNLPVLRPSERRVAHTDPAKVGRRHAERLIAQFAQKAGLGEQGAEALGHIAGSFAEGLAGRFMDIFKDKGGVPTSELSKAYKELGRRHDVDKFIAAPPAEVTKENGQLDSRSFKLVERKDNGLVEAKGSIAQKGHALGIAFDKLGLDMGGFSPDIGNIVEMAGNARKNLADKDSWISVVGQMATAAFGTPGDVKVRLAAAAQAGLEGVTKPNDAPTVIDVDPVDVKVVDRDSSKTTGATKGSGIGLERSAPKTSNTGSAQGAFAVRAALLSGLKSQDDAVERTAGKVLGNVLRQLGQEPDKRTKRALHGMLKRLMSDPKSTNGKTDVVTLMDRTVDALVAKKPERELLGELNGWIKDAVGQNPDFVADAGFQEAFGHLASDAITELVAAELGVKAPKDGKLTRQNFTALQQLLDEAPEHADSVHAAGAKETGAANEAEDAGPTYGPQEAPEVDTSRWAGAREDIPQQFRDQAVQFLTDSGVPADHPQARLITNAVAEVLQAATNPQTDTIHPADFALQMHQWLSDHAGASPQHVEAIRSQVTQAITAHGKMAEAYQSTLDRFNKLQTQQTTSTMRSNTAPLEKELEELQGELAYMQSAMKRGEESLQRDLAQLQTDGFRRMADFLVNGNWQGGEGPGFEAARNGGSGGNVPPNGGGGGGHVGGGGGGVPPGGGPPHGRGRGMFDRDGPTGAGILPGVNAGLRPEDDYNEKNLTVQQQRAIKCGEILADPSLTIEDKIFLFMMWFTAFTDQEREKKLEELVQMDRESARIQKLKDEKSSELKSLQGAKTKDETKLVQAKTRLDQLQQMDGAKPEDVEAAKAEVDACQNHLVEREQAIRGVEHEVSDLRAKHDKAPKSREMLFMEIERLNQLRDKIMNMARSIMENSNRAIEKIFR